MNDPWNRDSSRGRTWPIFLAVVGIVAVAAAAAWFVLEGAPSDRADGSSPAEEPTRFERAAAPEPPATDETETRVLGTQLDAPASSTTTSSTTTSSTTAPPATTTAPITSTGRFASAASTGEVRGSGEVRTYSVEAEEGSGVDPDQLADVVDVILADSRGWTAEGHAFQRVPSGGDFTITLATPATTDAICEPLDTAGRFSCHEGNRVVLNLTRWNEGTPELPLDLNGYRAQVVNHEVGHELGLGHVDCGGAGQAAPVMMQQSKGLDGCTANPWPTLDGR